MRMIKQIFKITLLLIVIFFLIEIKLFAQNMNYAEIAILNQSNGPINAYLTPVGTIFSAWRININYPENKFRYTFVRSREDVNPTGQWKYLVGSYNNFINIPNNGIRYVDFDDGTYCTLEDLVMGGIGFGLWHLKITDTPEDDSDPNLIDECWIDYRDLNYGNYTYNMTNDLIFIIKNINGDKQLWFKFSGGSDIEINNTTYITNKRIKIWHQVGMPGNPIFSGSPNLGNFKTTTYSSNTGINFLDFPIVGTNYPLNCIAHEHPEELDMNLSILSGHIANIKADNSFVVNNGATLKILNGGVLNFQSNSTLIIKSGSGFCNYGEIRGVTPSVSSIHWEKGGNFKICDGSNAPYKTINYVVEDSAIVEFPDSTTIVFDSTSVLTMKPHSEIRMGRYSKIIFENGSRITCDSSKFTSLDSTQTWDGIYLEGVAYDTLKNCTFQNAVNGINITDNYNPFGSPGAVEISNCTFKNSTSSDLLNYVYVNNSYNVLVKGCNSVKTGSGGYTSGIIAEYCPTNGVVIADNNINYVTTGISLLQSSEYIGRNTIIGSTNSGTGIYLDNSNGTIEYNTVNNFQKSVYGSYSSPYMLKNILSNAYIKNIDLASNSYPVMKPVVSGSTLRWLGGNNTITGTPTNSGIAFADCYPLMDSGYNRITVNGSDYMNGNFTFAYTTVYSRINYWYDNPPNSSLFDVSGGSVNYSNPFNGSSLPSTDGTELNLIGWGMYDTVFTKSLGDNSTPEDLFMQAYTEEMSENYTDAVTYYKEVVSSYKTSSLAPVSLSRIFNCLEKSQATSSDYQTIQSYYNGIKSNSVYPNESRELSEDFVIKSKVKQGNIEDAVSDYNAIYQANQNNSKGLHALLNKYCLESMVQGDNSSGNTNYENHKINILSLITGENIKTNNLSNNNTPKQFRLLQNYPNPFNPVTNIKYEIPKDVNVSIKIYDLLGKEVFSYNEYKKAGSYEVQFDGTNLASGMYFYQITAGNFTDTKKMVLLR